MAPNMVTSLGLFTVLFSFIIITIYDTQFLLDLPWWVYILNGLACWAYHIFDALDGKQARRTKSSSGLGCIFDHCNLYIYIFSISINYSILYIASDAFATVFFTIIMLQMFRIGPSIYSLFMLAIPQVYMYIHIYIYIYIYS